MYDGAGWLLLPEPELAIHIPMTMTPTMTHPRPDFPDPDGDDLAGATSGSGLAGCGFLSAGGGSGGGALGGAVVVNFGASVSISTSDISEERPAKPAAFLFLSSSDDMRPTHQSIQRIIASKPIATTAPITPEAATAPHVPIFGLSM